MVNIPGFTIIRKDRFVNSHGGICIYIREGDTKFKSLSEISCCPEHEILWLHIKPKRLPREFSSIIAAVLYHPPRPGNPKAWWNETKRLGGMKSTNSSIIHQINIDGFEDISEHELANRINTSLLEPLAEYQLSLPLDRVSLEDNPEFLEVSEERVLRHLQKLSSGKGGGPDEVPNWFLREYAVILALRISQIVNTSYKQQCLPSIWKFANVSPLPKVKLEQDLKRELRPISLTPSISKVAEDFVIKDYVKPAILEIIDPNQYGTIPKSSTTSALLI